MVGITRFGAYVPLHRLGPSTDGWSRPGERAVANFDEDAITMAVAAIRDCLPPEQLVAADALYFASTTAPYEEKQASVLVATAADLRPAIFTADVGHSLRAGTQALAMAFDAVAAGRLSHAIVAAADSRLGSPGSELEAASGDAAACLVVGSGGEVAVLEASASCANEINDVWRPAGELAVRSWEERFVQQEGYLASVRRVAEQFTSNTGREVASFDRVVLYAPDARRHAEAGRMLGLRAEQLQPPLFDRVGNSGSASALLQFVAALETAQPGQTILVISYGEGADALAFRTTPLIADQSRRGKRGVAGHLASALAVPAYSDYLKWRGLLTQDTGVRRPAGAGPSAAALHREQEQVLRFHGVRCTSCEAVMYPPQRICISCNKLDTSEPARLAGEPCHLFTYSMDYIAGTADVPLVLAVVDFDNGARAVLMMTDRDTERVAIDMALELTFRLARSGGGIANYYWKCAPLREAFVPAGLPV